MFPCFFRNILLSAIFLLSALVATGVESVKVLTIGNSFAGNATRYLDEIVEDSGKRILIGKANLGGASLKRHWEHVAAWKQDPQSEAARPWKVYGSRPEERLSLVDKLTEADWDYITIQQASFRSYRPETYEPYGPDLIAFVREHAPEAEILVHQTWAYREDDDLFDHEDRDQQWMYEALTKAYRNLASENGGLRILPVGAAFQAMRGHPDWNLTVPEFDKEALAYPQLPATRHSLNSGWEWKKRDGERDLYLDGHHANVNGEYLGALIWFGVLFEEDPRTVGFVPKEISPEDAQLLRKGARHTLTAKRGWF